MGPGSAALIVECQSDNKKRTLQDVRLIIKQNNGLLSPTRYCFQQRGLLVYEGGGVALEDILEPAIEAGAEDVELDVDGNIEVSVRVARKLIVD